MVTVHSYLLQTKITVKMFINNQTRGNVKCGLVENGKLNFFIFYMIGSVRVLIDDTEQGSIDIIIENDTSDSSKAYCN